MVLRVLHGAHNDSNIAILLRQVLMPDEHNLEAAFEVEKFDDLIVVTAITCLLVVRRLD